MSTRVLETVLTGRDLLSPMLGKAGASVAAFNAQVSGSNTKAAATAAEGAGVQSGASAKVVASNARNAESATVSAATQSRAHAKAAETATLSARAQQSASNALARSNGLLGTSLTPLTAGLGAVALGLGYAAYSAMGFDKSMSQVQAATQASASTMGALRKAALQAGADTKYSSTEAAQGITELAKAGVSTTDILNGGLVGALNLAAAGQLDVADAAEIGATALSVFNLQGNQMSHVADLLAAGAGKAQGSVGDLSMALNQSALVARNTGLSVEDTTGALALFAYNGLKGSDAGTSFKTMLQSLNPRSVEAANLMDRLGLNAYDAQGNFVGLSTYAEQLKTSLGNMSQEQRNAALQTIFGSDAVRAATILYQSGAKGVDEWTGKVNDAGFASRQAAQLQDNLAGDLEKLTGSAQTFFTAVGSGVQGPLRGLVQMLTGILNAGGDLIGFFGSLSGPMQLALVGFVGWAVAGGQVVKLLQGFRFATDVFTASVRNAGGPVSGLKNALGGLAKAIGPELAAAGAAYVISSVASSLDLIMHAGDGARTEVDQLNRSLGRIDSNTARIDATAQAIADMRDKLAAANAAMNDNSPDFANAAASIGNPLAMADLLGKFKDGKASVETFKDALADLEGQQTRTNSTADTLAKTMGISRDQVLQLADKYHIDLSDGLATARLQFAEYDAAQATSTSTTDAGSPSRDVLIAQLQSAADAASQAKTQTDLFKLSLDILTGAHVSLIQVESAFQEAVASSEGAMKGLHGSVLTATGGLNLQSESGRKASGVLLNVRDTAGTLISTMISQGKTADEVVAADARMRAGFIRSATQMGISAGDANRLANEILGIPKDRETKIRADVGQASGAIAGVQSQLQGLRDKTVTITTRTNHVDGTYSVTRSPSMAQAMGGVVHAYAAGGIERMSSRIAQIVHPNTLRIIGDRVKDDEFFIPDNNDARSLAIGAEYLRRHPMLLGAFNPASAAAIAGPAAPAPSGSWSASAMPGYGVQPAPQVTVQFFVDGQEFRGMAKTVVDGRLEDLYRKKTYR